MRVAVGVQECTQIDEDGLSVPFRGIRVRCYNVSYNVNCDAGCDASYSVNCDASCDVNYVDGTSTLAVMVCWWRPLSGRLFLGRENRLYATGSA